jgi:hypothetical protein
VRPLTADLGGLVSPFHDNTLNLIGKSLTLEPDDMVLSITEGEESGIKHQMPHRHSLKSEKPGEFNRKQRAQ